MHNNCIKGGDFKWGLGDGLGGLGDESPQRGPGAEGLGAKPPKAEHFLLKE